MAKYQKVFKGIALTILLFVVLLLRGIWKGFYVVLAGWCSWQLAAVGFILVFLLIGFLIWNGLRPIKRKIIFTCVLVLLALVLLPVGQFLDPFSYEVHSVQVEAGEDVVLFRPTSLRGHIYNIGRKGILVKIAQGDDAVSLRSLYVPELYEATVEGDELVFRVRNEERTECCRMDTADLPQVSGKDWATFFLNGYTVLYLGGMVWLFFGENFVKFS